MQTWFTIPPLLLTLLLAAAMYISRLWLAPLALPGVIKYPLAITLLLLGASIPAMGVLRFRANNTTVNPNAPERASTLVTNGIYRRTRNPMYVGFLLLLLGWAIYISTWVAPFFVLAYFIHIDKNQIPNEEAALQSLFGEAFVSYQQSVPRWL